MANIKCKEWIKAAVVRAIRTMAQTAVSLLGTGAVGILDVDWVAVLSASALAGLISILTSLTGLPECSAAALEEKKYKQIMKEHEKLGDTIEEFDDKEGDEV